MLQAEKHLLCKRKTLDKNIHREVKKGPTVLKVISTPQHDGKVELLLCSLQSFLWKSTNPLSLSLHLVTNFLPLFASLPWSPENDTGHTELALHSAEMECMTSNF